MPQVAIAHRNEEETLVRSTPHGFVGHAGAVRREEYGITFTYDRHKEQTSATNADRPLRLVEEEELSEKWLAIVEESMTDLRAGRFTPYEEMKEEFDL